MKYNFEEELYTWRRKVQQEEQNYQEYHRRAQAEEEKLFYLKKGVTQAETTLAELKRRIKQEEENLSMLQHQKRRFLEDNPGLNDAVNASRIAAENSELQIENKLLRKKARQAEEERDVAYSERNKAVSQSHELEIRLAQALRENEELKASMTAEKTESASSTERVTSLEQELQAALAKIKLLEKYVPTMEKDAVKQALQDQTRAAENIFYLFIYHSITEDDVIYLIRNNIINYEEFASLATRYGKQEEIEGIKLSKK